MRLFGLTITRHKALQQSLAPVATRGSWWPVIRESFTGAWQRNIEIRVEDVLTFSTLWACITLIATDVSKLWVKLVELDKDGICTETTSPAFSPVLRKPNRYQTRIKFFEYWILCKLIHGNAYVLKERDNRGVVVALYILDPQRVTVLMAPDGAVFYQLSKDTLAGVDDDQIVVPAREIIHDPMVPLHHPLVGVSPIHACGLAALQGLKIQRHSSKFFARAAQPSGILTAPLTIDPETATRLQNDWDTNFGGDNVGGVAVVGNDLKYQPLTIKPSDAQLIQQLKWTGITVCSTFHVPPWKVGIEPMPPYGNIQAGNIEYYSLALQGLIEQLELCLTEGLELPTSPRQLSVEFDLDALLRMDTKTQMEIAVQGVNAAIYTPNEARETFQLRPVDGGETPYMQQQNWPLRQLKDRPLPVPPMTASAALPPAPEADAIADDELDKQASWLLRKELEMAA